ncbi:ImmA/IrrE family metallo-endopeptidase [Rhodococcus opacus]|uniref:ImmA/IrrE family metallo-endopeptidase n=1 Tax=Rhodococcus opacus TaxID=37919 RepID=A0AAX3YPE5_RHOOP|nr:ImmA/IrrE family metallo-endopeptidase [Rhodococcus opacus]MCZ4589640.1 ImmA/IrrE family metallo-endopeptidase [Rhodococcus opacus]WLF51201.1 ImmA/IrrE family metallo-endopeptidase [Rhodococcus opacus]
MEYDLREQTAPDARERVDELLTEIHDAMPGPWSFDEFRTWLSRRRGVPVEMRPRPDDQHVDTPCGWTLVCEDRDIVYYPLDTPETRARFITYHEFAHLLFNHEDGETDRRTLVEQLAPDVNPDLVKKVFGRTNYDRPEEQEAELLALHLLRNDIEHLGIGVRSTNPRVATRVGRALRLLRGC